MGYTQERLLAGDEGRFDSRAPMSVNTTIGAVMAFLRYCKRHKMIADVPSLAKLSVDEVMKGRPISENGQEQRCQESLITIACRMVQIVGRRVDEQFCGIEWACECALSSDEVRQASLDFHNWFGISLLARTSRQLIQNSIRSMQRVRYAARRW